MFPVEKEHFQKYRINSDDSFTKMLIKILNKNESTIVSRAQTYLDAYADGKRSEMSSKIDNIIHILDNKLEIAEEANKIC